MSNTRTLPLELLKETEAGIFDHIRTLEEQLKRTPTSEVDVHAHEACSHLLGEYRRISAQLLDIIHED